MKNSEYLEKKISGKKKEREEYLKKQIEKSKKLQLEKYKYDKLSDEIDKKITNMNRYKLNEQIKCLADPNCKFEEIYK